MATRTVKARVELDGEKEYKNAIKELNNGNRVLASEMRKLQAEYKGNTESTEYLTKKGEVLEKQLLQQKDKVETLRAALQNAAKQYGEADSRTQQWAAELNNAEAAQYELEHAIKENNAALAGENATMVGLGDTVQQLAGKLGIQLPEGATKALNGMQGLSAGSVAAMAAAVAAVTALFKAVQQLHQMTLDAAHDVDDLVTKSMTTGLSTETLQKMKYAENLIDVSVDTITGSLTKLTKNMAAANDGNDAMSESFKDLGVSIVDTDGHLRNSEDVFYDVIDALGQIQNGTERDAAAMEILGKSAQDLNPLIFQGSDALRELGAEAEATGYLLDESQIQKLAEVDDAYQRMQLTIDATKKQLAAEFAPASRDAMELFSRMVKGAGDTLVQSGLIDNLVSVLRSVTSIFDAAEAVISVLPGWMNPINMLSTALKALALTMATIADAANLISGLMPWNWGSGRATTALGWNINNGQMSNIQKLMYGGDAGSYGSTYGNSYNAATGLYSGNYYAGNASGNDNWRGGLTYLAENGPETAILPSGTRILSAQDTRALSGGDTFVFNIEAKTVKEFNDLMNLVDTARVRRRMT